MWCDWCNGKVPEQVEGDKMLKRILICVLFKFHSYLLCYFGVMISFSVPLLWFQRVCPACHFLLSCNEWQLMKRQECRGQKKYDQSNAYELNKKSDSETEDCRP